MEVENVCSKVTFTREFPPGCGNLMTSPPPLKRFCSYSRVYPPECGPLAPKITPFYPPKNLFNRAVLGSKPSSAPGPGPARGPVPGGKMAAISLKRENFGSQPSSGPVSGLGPGPSRRMPVNSGKSVNLGTKPSSGPGLGLGLRPGLVSVKRENVGSNPLPGLGTGSSRVGGNVVVKRERSESEVVSEGRNVEGNSKERVKVVELLKLFRGRCDEKLKRGVRRVDVEADRELKGEGKIRKHEGRFGEIAGVEVGDKFYYRIELAVVGIHRRYQGGIDWMEWRGERYATCIVANEGHLDKMGDPNELSYIGEGGTLKRHEFGVPPDQQLVSGNQALDNSRREKRPVRVVRGLRYGAANAKIVYVYDGLYTVVDTIQKKGPQGNMVFEFRMTRNPGQAAVAWRELRRILA
ncbi:hypothetical protein vseg_016732 [Gypsophila vaccaria]